MQLTSALPQLSIFVACINGLQPLFDIDGDGQLRAATDGLLITRYLRGMRGATLLLNATNGSARTPAEIEQLLQTSTVQ